MKKIIDLDLIKNILFKLSPSAGAAFLIAPLALYGLVNNMSISYMGNTSATFEKYILDNFLGDIILFIGKILFAYAAVSISLGIIIQLFILSLCYLYGKKISPAKSTLINFGIAFPVFIITFFKDIILYPQVYMNNFYFKNYFNKLLVDYLTGNINPAILSALQIFIVSVFVVTCLTALIKIKNKIINLGLCFLLTVIIVASAFRLLNHDTPGKTGRPGILILASDALRPDHFSGYGYPRKTTPAIDRLIAGGVSFRNAFIEVPRTFPSWVSILTGQFASTHGIRHMFPTSRDLNRDFKSIAKKLREEGYDTSVVADYAGDIFSRIDLGFDRVDAPYFNSNYMIQQIILDSHTFLMPFLTCKAGLFFFPMLKDSAYFCPAEFVKDRVIASIKKSQEPFFVTAFFSSTHFPYSAPYPYYKLYADKNYSGPYRYYKQRSLTTDEDAELSPDDIAQINALYDGGLKSFDDAVGGILDYLSKSGKMDNTIIVVLSDHGENLYEDGLGMGHGEHFRGMYSIRIPLIIHFPGMQIIKKDITEVVRQTDIAPTILSILNRPVPLYMEGKSLLPLINGGTMEKLNAFGETGIWFDNTVREDLFFQRQRIMYPDITGTAETDFNFDNQIVLKDDYRDLINFAKHRYVFDGRYKLIYIPLLDRVSYELYDTKRDPDEKKNIVYVDKADSSRLRSMLFSWVQRNGDVIIKKDYIYPLLRY